MGDFESRLSEGYAGYGYKSVANAMDAGKGHTYDPDTRGRCKHPACWMATRTLQADLDKLEPDYEALARQNEDELSEDELSEDGLSDEEVWAGYETRSEDSYNDQQATRKPRIEEEAHDLVYGDRQAAYGHPSSDFTAMGRITAAILSRWLESAGYVVQRSADIVLHEVPEGPVRLPDIPPGIVALVMTAVKLSRESAQPRRDNRVDLIGYVLCKDRIEEGEPDGQ